MRLHWSPDAVADRDATSDHIAADNPAAALATDTAITRHLGRLIRFPQSGRTGRVAGTRELVIPRSPFIAIYRLTAAEIIPPPHPPRRPPISPGTLAARFVAAAIIPCHTP